MMWIRRACDLEALAYETPSDWTDDQVQKLIEKRYKKQDRPTKDGNTKPDHLWSETEAWKARTHELAQFCRETGVARQLIGIVMHAHDPGAKKIERSEMAEKKRIIMDRLRGKEAKWKAQRSRSEIQSPF